MLAPRPPTVSVLIPTLDEASWIGHSIASVRASAATAGVSVQIVVCDGGSRDDTLLIARRSRADEIVESSRACRARQLNAGLEVATADVIAFLHADSLILPETLVHMCEAIDQGCAGGWSQIEILPESGGLTATNFLDTMARGINLRTRLFRTATADQFIFAHREVLEVLGGLPEIPLFEGNRFARLMRDIDPVAILGPHVRISGRRWERNGLLRMLFLMYGLRVAERLGTPVHTLHEIWQRISSKS